MIEYKKLESSIDGVSLSLEVENKDNKISVRNARHCGAKNDKLISILDNICLFLQDRPLQEVVDHGLIYILNNFESEVEKVPGIQMPRNSSSQFILAEKLIRELFRKASNETGVVYRENLWYVKLSEEWRRKDEREQASILKPILEAFLKLNKLNISYIWICKIERGRRITVSFSDGVAYDLKPQLVMSLEKYMRKVTGDPLEVFVEEMRDVNKGRRL